MTNKELIEQIKTIIKSKLEQTADSTSPDKIDEMKGNVMSLIGLIDPRIAEKDSKTLDSLYQTARNEFLSVYPVDINPSSTLRKQGLDIWLTEDRKKKMRTDYIDRYITHLRKGGRSERVIAEITKSSEKILSNLGDPLSDTSFYVKGLVVGSVQSGKTGNFNAVINRAIDAGYSLIIILSGIMEDLRSQTQERIEKDVVGEGVIDKEKGTKGPVGVGHIRRFGELGDQSVPQAFSVTSYKSDFSRSVKEADFSLNNKNILVCKKNTGVLKNLLIWLSENLNEREKHNIPLLIIDDEADNASLNNLGHKGREYASTINGHIRAILELFTKKTYLGYTATPFANVLQDRNEPAEGKWKISYKSAGIPVSKDFAQVSNIFPDDFIELLNPPSNYIGAKQIFETVLDSDIKKIPLVIPIADQLQSFPEKLVIDGSNRRPATPAELDDKKIKKLAPTKYDLQNNNTFPYELPESLKDAVKCFVLSIALRNSRRPEMIHSNLYNPHHTMLVHVSRFITWQTKTRDLLSEYVKALEIKIQNDLPSGSASVYSELEKTWNHYYASIVTDIRSYLPDDYQDEFLTSRNFIDLKPLLIEAVKGIEVKAVNSETKDKLIYTEDTAKNGKKYIAVGGNRLSRGFTLEGLTINYFIRDTNYSDTLLQMGRWFGYRPGYLDCCKLFTTTDAIEKFDLTTKTVEELEMEFRKLERKNKTPKDFILRVLKHPGTLKITRPSILKNTISVKWSYQDKLEQTTSFDLNADRIKAAWVEFQYLVTDIKQDIKVTPDFFIYKTDHEGLLRFLSIKNSFHNYANDIENIKKFIELCVVKNKLQNWTIAIKRKGRAGILSPDQSNLPEEVHMVERRGPDNGHYLDAFLKGVFTSSGKSANIVTAGKDFSILLSKSEIEAAEKDFREDRLKYYTEEKALTIDAARVKANSLTLPERIYRERIPDTDGLMIIYIIDTKLVFAPETMNAKKEMLDYIETHKIDTAIPLIGYAIGFPPIDPDPGKEYVRGDYSLDEDEPETEEFDEELQDNIED